MLTSNHLLLLFQYDDSMCISDHAALLPPSPGTLAWYLRLLELYT